MKCGIKASYILMSCHFCISICSQSVIKVCLFHLCPTVCTNNKHNECDVLFTDVIDPERIGK
jgi:hypothetical protein